MNSIQIEKFQDHGLLTATLAVSLFGISLLCQIFYHKCFLSILRFNFHILWRGTITALILQIRKLKFGEIKLFVPSHTIINNFKENKVVANYVVHFGIRFSHKKYIFWTK